MAYQNQAGLGVYNQYGPRDTGGTIGIEDADGSTLRVSINLTADSVNSGFVPPVNVPKGALFRRAVLRVDEVFALTGTSPTVLFGAAGTVATNGIALSKAELEAVGTKVPASTGVGTWASNSATGTTAAAKIGQALGGTTPVVTAGTGKGVLVLEFFTKAKA